MFWKKSVIKGLLLKGKGKRAMEIWEIVGLMVAVFLLIIIALAIKFLLIDKGGNLMDFIKHLIRFGR